MNEANDIHRDIYVGMVAEEMAQSGYYGEDVTLYGFLANGTLHSFDTAQENAEAYLLALAAGAEVSRMMNVHQRCPKKRSVRAGVCDRLRAEMQRTLSAEEAAFARRSVDLRPLHAYAQTLPKPRNREQEAAVVGIMTLPTFAIKPDERAAVLDVKQSFEAPEGNRCFFGFLEKHGDEWQPQLNGALPVLLEKWLAAAGCRSVTPILPMQLNSTKPIYQLRDDFVSILTATMDTDYLRMLDELYASQG